MRGKRRHKREGREEEKRRRESRKGEERMDG